MAVRVAAALVLGAATFAVLRPFLTPLAWAAIIAYVTWPLYRRLRQRAQRPSLAAAAFTAFLAIGIGIPVALLTAVLAEQATSLAQTFGSWWQDGGTLPTWITERSWYQHALAWLQASPLGHPGQAGDVVGRAGAEVSKRLVGVASGLARNVFEFGVTLVTLYAFYINGERIAEMGKRLTPLLFASAPEGFVERIGDSVRAVVFGLLGTALVQGALAGIGLAVAGVPSAVALGAATVFTSFLPGGGGAITLIAAVWIGFEGRIVAAVLLGLWSLLVVSSVDNVLRPLLISERSDIPFLMVFFGVLGGLATFGLIGLFIGPVLLSVSFAMVAEFARTAAPKNR
jgi:predicted PurR-regulated permease PerM